MKFIKYTFFLILTIVAVGFYYINRPVKNLSNATADYSFSSNELFYEFQNDENAANKKYIDKIIQVNGVIRSISSDNDDNVNIMLESDDLLSGINCQLEKDISISVNEMHERDSIRIKGICSGMLMDVVLIKCVIL